MGKPGPATQAKRQRERAKQEKRQEKEAERAFRKEQKAVNAERAEQFGGDPDLIGIFPGPHNVPQVD